MARESIYQSHSAEETCRLGARLAACLRAGDLVILSGNLGAGKTALVRGVASAMGVAGHVSSPTFTLLHIHEALDGKGPALHHFDVYRLEGPDDFLANGLDEYVGDGAVALIEWGDRVREALDGPVMEIEVRYGSESDERQFILRFPEEWKTDGKGRMMDADLGS